MKNRSNQKSERSRDFLFIIAKKSIMKNILELFIFDVLIVIAILHYNIASKKSKFLN